MVRLLFKALFILAGAALALTACNDSAKQYRRTSYSPPNGNLDKVLSDHELELEKATLKLAKATDSEGDGKQERAKIRLSEAENARRAKLNANAPIIFGKTISNLKLDTSLEQAQKIMSEPVGESEDGLMVYREGIYIVWKKERPRTIEQILVNDGYTGEFVQLTKYFQRKGKSKGAVKIGTSFEDEFAEDNGEGFELLKHVVRAAMDKGDDFDCRAEGICDIEDKDGIVRMSFPQGLVLFSSDRKQLYGANLQPSSPTGRLANPLDIILGQVHDKESNITIRLGESWTETNGKIGKEQKITMVLGNTFVKRYGDAVVQITRSKFDRTYLQPAGAEKLKTLVAFASSPYPVKIKGQYLKWQKANDGVEVSYVDPEKASEEKGLIRLTTEGLETTKLQYQVMEKVNEKILEKMQEEYGSVQISDEQRIRNAIYKPLSDEEEYSINTGVGARAGNIIVGQRLVNLHRAASGSIQSSTFVYDLGRKTGRSATYEFDTSKKSFERFSTSLLLNEMDYLVASTSAEKISAKKRQLLGLDLKTTKIELKDIDLGRKEAALKVITDRGSFEDRIMNFEAVYALNITLANSTEKIVPVALAPVSSFKDVNLYLSDASANPKLVAIETSQFMAGVTDLCDMKGFTARKTQSVKSFMIELKKALAEADAVAKKENKEHDCKIAYEKDVDGTGELRSVTFIKDRTRFNFANRELNTVLFY